MGEMLRYLLVAAFFVIVEVIAVGKKKKKRPAAKLHEPKRAAPPEATQKHADEQAMEQAGEGEDPCHAGAAPKRPEPDEAYEPTEEEARRAAFQSDVLRGVIMSEILTRPGERAAVRRMKRGR